MNLLSRAEIQCPLSVLGRRRGVSGGGGGEQGTNPPIRYDLLTKFALPFSRGIRNPGPKNRRIRNTLQLQDPEIREIHALNPKSGKNIFKIRRTVCPFTPLYYFLKKIHEKFVGTLGTFRIREVSVPRGSTVFVKPAHINQMPKRISHLLLLYNYPPKRR